MVERAGSVARKFGSGKQKDKKEASTSVAPVGRIRHHLACSAGFVAAWALCRSPTADRISERRVFRATGFQVFWGADAKVQLLVTLALTPANSSHWTTGICGLRQLLG